MLTAFLRLCTEDLTSGDDDLEHDLEEADLTHNRDFGDSEEALCADVVEECTFLFHEEELEDDCGELHQDQ